MTSVFEQQNSVRVLDRAAAVIGSFQITLFKTKITPTYKSLQLECSKLGFIVRLEPA
jgi:hypothetical protein